MKASDTGDDPHKASQRASPQGNLSVFHTAKHLNANRAPKAPAALPRRARHQPPPGAAAGPRGAPHRPGRWRGAERVPTHTHPTAVARVSLPEGRYPARPAGTRHRPRGAAEGDGAKRGPTLPSPGHRPPPLPASPPPPPSPPCPFLLWRMK